MILDGQILAAQSFVAWSLEEIAWQHKAKYPHDPPTLHPFVYVLPFFQHVGSTAGVIRNKCRDEVVDLERKTGTSVYEAEAEIDIFNRGDIETMTRRAHICGQNVAESQKYLCVHRRGVEEFVSGFQRFQKRYKDDTIDTEGERIQAERVQDALRQQLDFCKGVQMELDNLSKRVDIQINMVPPPTALLLSSSPFDLTDIAI
jgi:hypothetical protein